MVDLHIHSNVTLPGDGGDSSPSDIVKTAQEIGLKAIALTDHDSVKGISEAQKSADKVDIKFISGVEIACNFKNLDIEVVGLHIDWKKMDEYLYKSREQIIKEKRDFVRRTRERCSEYGVDLGELDIKSEDIDELYEVVHKSYLVEKNKEACKQVTNIYPESESDYYQLLFAPRKPCRVVKDVRSLSKSIEMIHECGGKAFLAHPRKTGLMLSYKYIESTLQQGLDGIECVHSDITPKESARLIAFCSARGVLKSGGSDTHKIKFLQDWNSRLQIPNSFVNWLDGAY